MMRTFKLFFLATLSMVILGGCVHQELTLPTFTGGSSGAAAQGSVDVSDLNTTPHEEQSVIPRVPFPVEEYARLKRSGTGTVTGSIYVTNADGVRIYGRQTRLYLNPVTSYSRQWYQESYIGGYKMAKADPRLFNYLRFTTSDAAGKFAFYGVPAGSYYVIGVVRCGSECGFDTPKNIRVAREVSVGEGQTVSVELAKTVP